MDPDKNPAGNEPAEAAANDDAEWEETGLDFLSDRGIETDKREEEQGAIQKNNEEEETPPESKPGEGDESGDEGDQKPAKDENTDPDDPDGQKPVSSDDEESNDKSKQEEPEAQPEQTPEQADREYRRRQLELEADRKEIAKDVREKMFSDVPTQLTDADGDPIESVADVMQLKNPVTGKRFTAEEASQWLLGAQRQVEKQQDATEKEVEKITDVNLNLKEEADTVRDKYGELLAHMPKLRQRVWSEYQKTLKRDEKTDTIIDAPVSMEAFYNTVLAPYMREVEKLKSETAAEEQRKAKEAADAKKKKVEEEKRYSQSDREDIFSTRTKSQENMDPEEKEWAEVAKEHFEG